MDEHESPDNSSNNTSEDEIRTGGDGDTESSPADGPLDGENEETISSEPGSADDGFTLVPEDLPTMQWSDVYAELAEFEDLDVSSDPPESAPAQTSPRSSETGPLEGLEDAMNWLEELAAGQGMPIDEMPTLVSVKPDPVDIPPEEESLSGEALVEDLAAPDLTVDSDPMAWLEQLAVDQSSPLEELPSVADRLLASEIVSQTDIPPNSTINDPYDVDEALNYLEQAAVNQGIDLSGVTFDADQPVDRLRAALAIVDGLALTGLAARSAAFEEEPTPDENGDAPAVDEPQIVTVQSRETGAVAGDELETEVVDIAPIPITEEDADIAPITEEDAGVEPITEEDAGVEPAAADQETDLSAEMPDDPNEALDWLGAMGDGEEEAPLAVVVEEDTAGPEVETPGGDLSAEETIAKQPPQVDEGTQLDSDVLEEMPDDPDEAVAWMEHLARQGSQNQKSVDEEPPAVKERPSPAAAKPSPDQAAAMTALAAGDLDQAFGLIQAILDDEAATPELVEALEDAVEHHQDSPRLLRFLGDAYMQVGEVDKAIETYRKGFDHL